MREDSLGTYGRQLEKRIGTKTTAAGTGNGSGCGEPGPAGSAGKAHPVEGKGLLQGLQEESGFCLKCSLDAQWKMDWEE